MKRNLNEKLSWCNIPYLRGDKMFLMEHCDSIHHAGPARMLARQIFTSSGRASSQVSSYCLTINQTVGYDKSCQDMANLWLLLSPNSLTHHAGKRSLKSRINILWGGKLKLSPEILPGYDRIQLMGFLHLRINFLCCLIFVMNLIALWKICARWMIIPSLEEG